MFSARAAASIVALLVIVLSIPSCSGVRNARATKLTAMYEKAGEALLAKRYDEAIRAYDECLKMSPGDPWILTSKSMALRGRGFETYNSGIKIPDAELKQKNVEAGKADFQRAAELSGQAVSITRDSLAIQITYQLSLDEIKLSVISNHAENLRLVAAVDKSRTDEAVEAWNEYIDLEEDVPRKAAARLVRAKLLLESGKGDRALAEYRKLLEEDPGNLDATLGIGLALSQSGEQAKFAEAKTYLQKFVEAAPDDHPMKKDIQQTLEYMK